MQHSLDYLQIKLEIVSWTRTLGAAGPLVLAPVEGVGALRAPCLCIVLYFFPFLYFFCLFLSFLSFFCIFFSIFFCIFLSFLSFLSFCPFVLLSFLYFCIFVFLPFCLFVFLPFFLFVTTIIIPGSISTTTPIFIPIQQFFQFYHTFHHKPLPLLPPTPHIVLCT